MEPKTKKMLIIGIIAVIVIAAIIAVIVYFVKKNKAEKQTFIPDIESIIHPRREGFTFLDSMNPVQEFVNAVINAETGK